MPGLKTIQDLLQAPHPAVEIDSTTLSRTGAYVASFVSRMVSHIPATVFGQCARSSGGGTSQEEACQAAVELLFMFYQESGWPDLFDLTLTYYNFANSVLAPDLMSSMNANLIEKFGP
jgi:hypothetical protein